MSEESLDEVMARLRDQLASARVVYPGEPVEASHAHRLLMDIERLLGGIDGLRGTVRATEESMVAWWRVVSELSREFTPNAWQRSEETDLAKMREALRERLTLAKSADSLRAQVEALRCPEECDHGTGCECGDAARGHNEALDAVLALLSGAPPEGGA